ncbi:hypothetical protein [Paenibacillus borealis]|uniref:Bacteriophage SP-beta YorD domain-containing protein n=1 Tax=Paenibacillus borealis TaxID=160799 RepID=A0A089LLW6_PAEBO|nr:hypothetical protein [Paenibacillus borealis]AIQ61075.1 hypothetical protein PBOR_32320 [Paenibacillus borealis]
MSYFCAYDIRDGVGYVYATYHDTESLEGVDGVTVDVLPEPIDNGKDPVLKVNLTDARLYYDYEEPKTADPYTPKVIELEQRITNTELDLAMTQLALTETFEELQVTRQEAADSQLALTELYELMLAGQTGLEAEQTTKGGDEDNG